jgi:two-component system response regulator NreC
MISVLLAEDHETVREGLRLLVNAQHDMKVIAEAADGGAVIDRARALKPTAIVMDLNMPLVNGLEATRILRAAVPDCAVIVLTRHNDKSYLREMLDAGAAAYVLKQSSSTELLSAIRAAVAGMRYIDPALRDETAPLVAPRRQPGAPIVSDRECEVLRRMALGHSNKEIAAALEITVKTVEVHKANAMRKLSLRGRTDVVRYAALNGWLKDP